MTRETAWLRNYTYCWRCIGKSDSPAHVHTRAHKHIRRRAWSEAWRKEQVHGGEAI